jgi:hypothetical protein
MQAQPQFGVAIGLGLVALVTGALVVGLLFCFKKTRPVGWTLLGLGILAGVGLFGATSVYQRQRATAEMRRAMEMKALAQWAHTQHEAIATPSVDPNALLQPRIELPTVDEAGHPAVEHLHESHPVQPAETMPPEPAPVEAAPAEPVEDTEDDAPEESPAESADTPSSPTWPPTANQSRPSWVDQPPARDSQSYPVVSVTDPFASKHEADRQVSQQIVIAASEVVSDLVGHYGPHHSDLLGMDQNTQYQLAMDHLWGMNLTPGMLRNKVWRDEYVEHLDLSLPSGPMLRVHTLLVFDQDVQSELQERWRQRQAQKRLHFLGMGAGGVLGILALAWSMLKFDTLTKGYYTKWLVIGGSAATALLVVLARALGFFYW